MLQGHFQQTVTTTSAHLAQTMTLLSQTTSELQQTIETELSNNPALELIEDRFCPMCRRALPPHRTLPNLQSTQRLCQSGSDRFYIPSRGFLHRQHHHGRRNP